MGLFEQNEARAAHEFARAVVDLVGADAQVIRESPVAEFDCILSIIPRVRDAVVLDVMILGTQLVVVWARRPCLGWWTFEGAAAQSASWAVIAQIVDGGGQAVREKRGNLLLLRDGVVRLLDRGGATVAVMDDGGSGPWKRVTNFPPYRP
ncbi:hypothetical protein ACIPVB_11040 [Microbacterium sp. NPDC090007]|uniref:hypothetical protein n=1 Tax=Microbacterium sp. NPDC090007 TaxID=3364204 RepID=UPI003803B3D3